MRAPELLRAAGRVAGIAVSAAACGALIGLVWQQLNSNQMPLWLVARAAGAAAFVLLTAATLAGIVLSHPDRARLRWPRPEARLRLHVSLTVFAVVFTVLHVVVLAIDPYAKVGWAGALLPMGAAYRPVPVTLGVIALWAGLVAGLSAALAGRVTIRWWRSLHRIAALAWLTAWAHALLAGSDTPAWTLAYVAAGLAVLGTAWWRYAATRPVEHPKAAVPPPVPVRTGRR